LSIVQYDAAAHRYDHQSGRRILSSQEQITGKTKRYYCKHDYAAETCEVARGFLKPGRSNGSGRIGRITQRKNYSLIERERPSCYDILSNDAEYEKQTCYRQDGYQRAPFATL